jgi:hypothetical protein
VKRKRPNRSTAGFTPDGRRITTRVRTPSRNGMRYAERLELPPPWMVFVQCYSCHDDALERPTCAVCGGTGLLHVVTGRTRLHGYVRIS